MPSVKTPARATAARKSSKAPVKPQALTKEALDRMPVNVIWAQYAKTRAQVIRDYFWEKYTPLARYIAERTAARLPNEVDVGDLLSAGCFGLRDAIEAFDLSRGVKFETFCATRIKGAILDELRGMDWVPRLVRHRSAKVDRARRNFEMQHGRPPTNNELSSLLGVNGEDFEKIERDSSAVGTVSLTRRCFQSDGNKEVLEIDVIKDGTQADPYQQSQKRDLKDLITKGLSRAERLIVILYYYEEMTMKEIGNTLALSESRVSQMHSSILARLKAQMQHREGELEPEE